MDLLPQAAEGFQTVPADDATREQALKFLRQWLTEPGFAAYRPQLERIIERKQWAALLDRFYQILPFGTGGRRGAVGIGPNRMNLWTVGASVQGHCEYLKERFPELGRLLVVLAYDVRQFEDKRGQYAPDLPNPVLHLSSKSLAHHAAGVYVANDIRVAILPPDSPRYLATPELSYFIRELHAHGGLNLSASHNPPDDNGGKFYDERGGQPVPPDDQIMADIVDQVTTIRHVPWNEALRGGKVMLLDDVLHRGYVDLCRKQSLVLTPKNESFKVVFSPLHGVGSMTALEIIQAQGFDVIPVESQMTPDGQFPNVTKSPNPEVPESLDRARAVAVEHGADIVLATDPDADRLGGMAPDREGNWHYLTGNQIAALLTHFKLSKLSHQGRLPRSPIVVSTEVTTRQVTRIARHFGAQVADNLLVGFKYVADVLWHLEHEGRYEDIEGGPQDFVIAVEESHGILLTPQIRDKDAGAAALLMAELALDQKRKNRTVLDYLDGLAREFGYFRNAGVQVVMPGLQGKQQMALMLDRLRQTPPTAIGGQAVTQLEDLRNEDGRLGSVKGATDAASRNVLIFRCGESAKVVLRPSGTEPKAKIYLEVSTPPCPAGMPAAQWLHHCREADELLARLSKDFQKHALGLIGLDPETLQ
jgi:phosphoglucomutase/phosphomannomutase